MQTHDAPWAVITGASRGLGSAFAEACAARGMRLALVALPGTGLCDRSIVLKERFGIEVVAIEADLSDREQRSRFAEGVLERCAPIALLVNNAGIGRNGRIDEIDAAFQSRMVDLNVGATVDLSRRFLPALEKAAHVGGEPSSIIIVSSLAAFQPMPLFGVYAATKSFLLHFGLALRHEAAERNIRVTVLCPGGILTNDEARAKIAAQGLIGKLSSQEAAFVAEAALRGAEKGKPIVIPGWFNRMVRLFSAWLPLDAAAHAVHARWKAALCDEQHKAARSKPLAAFMGRLAYRLAGGKPGSGKASSARRFAGPTKRAGKPEAAAKPREVA